MSDSTSGGIGFFGLLFIVFLILKLTDTIAWSWWWVSAPLWAPLGIALGVCLIVIIVGVIVGLFS